MAPGHKTFLGWQQFKAVVVLASSQEQHRRPQQQQQQRQQHSKVLHLERRKFDAAEIKVDAKDINPTMTLRWNESRLGLEGPCLKPIILLTTTF